MWEKTRWRRFSRFSDLRRKRGCSTPSPSEVTMSERRPRSTPTGLLGITVTCPDRSCSGTTSSKTIDANHLPSGSLVSVHVFILEALGS